MTQPTPLTGTETLRFGNDLNDIDDATHTPHGDGNVVMVAAANMILTQPTPLTGTETCFVDQLLYLVKRRNPHPSRGRKRSHATSA